MGRYEKAFSRHRAPVAGPTERVRLVVVRRVVEAGVMSWILALAAAGFVAGSLGRVVLLRCRHAIGSPPLVPELATSVLWAGVAVAGVPPWRAPAVLAFAAFAVPLTIADLSRRVLPNALTLPAYPAVGIALVVAALGGAGGLIAGLGGAILLGGVYLVVHTVAPAALGAGDVKLAGVAGAVAGSAAPVAPVLVVPLAALVTLALCVPTRWRIGAPHGPGLAAATCLVAVTPGI